MPAFIHFCGTARLSRLLAAFALMLAASAIPDPSPSRAATGPGSEIVGCRAASDGTLRIVDPAAGQACRASESVIVWNRRGDTGPAGRDSVGTIVRKSATYALADHPGRLPVRCGAGTTALSWGHSFTRRGSYVAEAGPLPEGAGWWIRHGRVAGNPPPSADDFVTVYVLCAPTAAFSAATITAGASSNARLITACRRSGGAVRIIGATARCRADETTVTWADRGRRGGAGAGPLARRVTVSSTRVLDGQALVACPEGTVALAGWYRTDRPVSGHGPLEDGAGWQVAVQGPASVSVTCTAPSAGSSPVEADGPSLTGCRNPRTGAFRLLAGGSCTAGERILRWRQGGLTGLTGAPGELLDYVAAQDARFEPPSSIPGTVSLRAECEPGQTRLGGGAIVAGVEVPMSLPSSDGTSWRAALHVRSAETEAWAVAICVRA